MSRIGKLPIPVPAGVDVEIDGRDVTVKGPKGTLSHQVAGAHRRGPGGRHRRTSPGGTTSAGPASCTA